MQARTWICQCGNRNGRRATACSECGRASAVGGTTAKLTASAVPRECPADGAILEANGLCPRGRGFPATMRCPFVCPLCRQPLDWDGGCPACHGCTSALRQDWSFPGDRYELEDGHYRWVAKGGRRACTPEENAEGLARVRAILAGGAKAKPPVVRLIRQVPATGPGHVLTLEGTSPRSMIPAAATREEEP